MPIYMADNNRRKRIEGRTEKAKTAQQAADTAKTAARYRLSLARHSHWRAVPQDIY